MSGETPVVAVVRECAEELGFPVAVLSKAEFKMAAKFTDLSLIGILNLVEEDKNFCSIRKTVNGELAQPFITYFFIGYYDGSMRFKDGESSGLETFSLPELKGELKNNPEKFTQDLHFMVKKFEKYLVPLKKSI